MSGTVTANHRQKLQKDTKKDEEIAITMKAIRG